MRGVFEASAAGIGVFLCSLQPGGAMPTVFQHQHISRRTFNVMTIQGYVKWFDEICGYGFLARDDGERDVFSRRSAR